MVLPPPDAPKPEITRSKTVGFGLSQHLTPKPNTSVDTKARFRAKGLGYLGFRVQGSWFRVEALISKILHDLIIL